MADMPHPLAGVYLGGRECVCVCVCRCKHTHVYLTGSVTFDSKVRDCFCHMRAFELFCSLSIYFICSLLSEGLLGTMGVVTAVFIIQEIGWKPVGSSVSIDK